MLNVRKTLYVPQGYIQHIRDSIAAAKAVNNVCYIYNNDVYFLDEMGKPTQRITNTPTNTKTEVRISHNLQKIAYLNSAGNPEIVNRQGIVLNTLTAFSNITQMDWSNTDSKLYMLIGNQFQYFGPVINHPPLDMAGIPNYGNNQILSASLSKYNDLAYVVEWNTFYGYEQRLVLKMHDGLGRDTVINKTDFMHEMKYVKFSTDQQDLVVGYGETSDFGVGHYFTRIEIFTDMKPYYDFYMGDDPDYNGYKYAVYRRDKYCLLSSNQGLDNTSGQLMLTAYYTNDHAYRSRNDINDATSELIFDWK